MNHTYIEEQHIADRYVRGNLAAEEAQRFEEHYLSCPECLDRLALAESMERGFKRAAGQDAARLAVGRQLALVAWLTRLGRSRQMAVLSMALFVLAVLPAGLALREVGQRGRELEQTRSVLEQERERSATGARSAEAVETLRSELDASRRDLAAEREARANADQQLAESRKPQVNVPILFFGTDRSGPQDSEPIDLQLPSAPGSIVLVLPVDPPTPRPYRVILRDARGREIWRGDDLRLDERDSLSLSLPSSLLAPGGYTFAIEGIPLRGKPVAAGRFSFRAQPARK